MTAAERSLVTTLWLVLFVAGAGAMACARWTRPIADGDEALAGGQWDRALGAYAHAERRFDRAPVTRQFLARDYNRVVANQLWLYYRTERYDDLIAKAERAPDGAAPHFWSGLACLAKGQAETGPEAQLGWLIRSEEELRRAVEAAPADWDTKFDFELVTRLTAGLRKQPKTPPNQLMQVLRPQPGTKPARRVG
jgi:hypothetical protein